MSLLNEEPGDWDFRDDTGSLDISKRIIREHYLFLDHLRSPYNVGSIFRTAEGFGVKKIFISPYTPLPENNRVKRVSMGTIDIVDYEKASLDEVINLNMPIFALELGGKDISTFSFPSSGIMIIGGEEDGVSKESLKAADNSLGRVSIKTFGAKGSLNVSSAVAIALYKWAENEK